MLTGLVLAVPALQDFVDRHRHPADGAGRLGVPAHVTALYPWLPQPIGPDAVDRLAELVAGFGPVPMTFRRVATFPTGVVHLPPEPADRVRALTHLLAAAYPGCPPYGGEFPDPQPHLTVTTAPVPEMVEWTARIERDLVPVTVTVASLTLLEQQPDARWRVTGTLPLTRPGPPHHRAAPRIGLP